MWFNRWEGLCNYWVKNGANSCWTGRGNQLSQNPKEVKTNETELWRVPSFGTSHQCHELDWMSSHSPSEKQRGSWFHPGGSSDGTILRDRFFPIFLQKTRWKLSKPSIYRQLYQSSTFIPFHQLKLSLSKSYHFAGLVVVLRKCQFYLQAWHHTPAFISLYDHCPDPSAEIHMRVKNSPHRLTTKEPGNTMLTAL